MGYALGVRTSMPAADQKLIQIVDAALAETARKSGEWLVCRKGCTQCCTEYSPSASWMQCALRKGLLISKPPIHGAQRRSANGCSSRWRGLRRIFPQCQVRILDDDEDG